MDCMLDLKWTMINIYTEQLALIYIYIAEPLAV